MVTRFLLGFIIRLPFPAVIVHGIDNIIAWKSIGVKRQHRDVLIHDRDVLIRDQDVLIRDRDVLIRDQDVLIRDRDVLIRDRDVLIRRDGCSTPGRRVAWLASACYNTTRIAAFLKPGVRQRWRGMESI
jgi:hypothetical protein